MTDETFKPTIKNNKVLAGGLTLAEVTPDGHLVFKDRLDQRCRRRGTDMVRVDLCELMDELLHHYRQRIGPTW